jgi:hypothetical protein
MEDRLSWRNFDKEKGRLYGELGELRRKLKGQVQENRSLRTRLRNLQTMLKSSGDIDGISKDMESLRDHGALADAEVDRLRTAIALEASWLLDLAMQLERSGTSGGVFRKRADDVAGMMYGNALVGAKTKKVAGGQ